MGGYYDFFLEKHTEKTTRMIKTTHDGKAFFTASKLFIFYLLRMQFPRTSTTTGQVDLSFFFLA